MHKVEDWRVSKATLPRIHFAYHNTLSVFTSKFPAHPFIHPLSGLSCGRRGWKAGVQGNSPWGLSPAAACDVGCVFSWPLQGHCDKSGTGLQWKEAVESQTDIRIISFWGWPWDRETKAGAACKGSMGWDVYEKTGNFLSHLDFYFPITVLLFSLLFLIYCPFTSLPQIPSTLSSISLISTHLKKFLPPWNPHQVLHSLLLN